MPEMGSIRINEGTIRIQIDTKRIATALHGMRRGGHTDGDYAEVMLREHLQALARQGLTREGDKHDRN
jgi:hypothetical protein